MHRTAQTHGAKVVVLALAEGVAADVVEAPDQPGFHRPEALPASRLTWIVARIDEGLFGAPVHRKAADHQRQQNVRDNRIHAYLLYRVG